MKSLSQMVTVFFVSNLLEPVLQFDSSGWKLWFLISTMRVIRLCCQIGSLTRLPLANCSQWLTAVL